MTRVPTNQLLKLRTEAGLAKGSKPLPLPVASLFRLRHSWCNSDVLHAIRHTREKTDKGLIYQISEDLYIDWTAVDAYQTQRQIIADQKGLDLNRVLLKFKFEIMSAVVVDMFKDRIYLLGASTQTRRKERLKTLNASWRKFRQNREDLDPLQHWRSSNAQSWLTQPQWNRDQFVSLMHGLDPAKFNEDEVELSVPFSIIGGKVLLLIKKIDDAAGLQFPSTSNRLLTWARANDVNIPVSLRSRRKSKAVVAAPPASTKDVDRILRILVEFAPDAEISFVRQHLRDFLAEVFGSRLSGNQFQTKIWIEIPDVLKLGHRPEKPEWFDAWDKVLPDLRIALAPIIRQKP